MPEFDIIKEGVLLRNVSPSSGLSDHFPGCGILNYRSDRDWSLRVCNFVTLLKIDLVGTMSTPITPPMISPKIGILP